jgi:hypothetical protein
MTETQQRQSKWMDERMAVERRRSRELREMLRANKAIATTSRTNNASHTSTGSLSQTIGQR